MGFMDLIEYTGRYANRSTDYKQGRNSRGGDSVDLPLEPIPEGMPFEVYSSLMGLLASAGACLDKGPNWWIFINSTVLKLTFKDTELLELMRLFFGPYFRFPKVSHLANKTRSSQRYISQPCLLSFNLWCH